MMEQATINHPVLGELIYEALLKGYVGVIELSEMPLKINLIGTEESTINTLADQLIDFLESEDFAEAFIAGLEKLLLIKNQAWLNEGEAEFTLDELCDFVSLDAIVMYSHKMELYTDDLDLLWCNRAVMIYNNACQLIDVIVEENEA